MTEPSLRSLNWIVKGKQVGGRESIPGWGKSRCKGKEGLALLSSDLGETSRLRVGFGWRVGRSFTWRIRQKIIGSPACTAPELER